MDGDFMEILGKYPDLEKQLELLYENRCNEILTELLKEDETYVNLCDERTDASMALMENLDATGVELFEKYSDSIYALEIYELDKIYRQATQDVLKIFQDNGSL